MSLSKISNDEKSTFPWILPEDIPQWTILLEAHLDAKGCLDALRKPRPTFSEEKYEEIYRMDGRRYAHSYRRSVTRRAEKWDKHNATCFDVLVKSCLYCVEGKTVWMDNKGVSAKVLKEKLDARFVPKDKNAVINFKLGSFNVMEISQQEDGGLYSDRIIRNALTLEGLGHKLDRNIHCLERLVNGLAADPRYEQLAQTLESIPDLTWERAVNLVASHDGRARRKLTQTPTSTQGNVAPTLKLDSKGIEQLKRMLKIPKKGQKRKREEGSGSTNQSTHTSSNIICYVCGKKGHKAHKCIKRHKAADTTTASS